MRKYSENIDAKFEMQSTQSEKGLLRRRLNGPGSAWRRRRRPLLQQQDNQKVAMADIVSCPAAISWNSFDHERTRPLTIFALLCFNLVVASSSSHDPYLMRREGVLQEIRHYYRIFTPWSSTGWLPWQVGARFVIYDF